MHLSRMTSGMTTPIETLSGLVEHVTYHDAENDVCALRIKARTQRDLMVVGHAAFISASGWWIDDPGRGLPFKASHVATTQPTTLEGIERYPGQGMIRGSARSAPGPWSGR